MSIKRKIPLLVIVILLGSFLTMGLFTTSQVRNLVTGRQLSISEGVAAENVKEINDFVSQQLVYVDETANTILLLLGVIFLVSAIAAVLIGKSIAAPIVELSAIIERLSRYDLTFDEKSNAVGYLNRKGEIGVITSALAAMQQNFIHLIRGISDSSQQVASSAEELTATSQQSATAANEVAKTIEEIAQGAADQAGDTEKGRRTQH